MTDEIKVGDRFLVPVKVVTYFTKAESPCQIEISGDGVREYADVTIGFLRTCQRLPPEIGVGDEVRFRDGGIATGIVVYVDAGEWFAILWRTGGHAWHRLSDLTLVKKAEKG